MDDGDGAEVDEARRDCGFLGGDDDSYAEVALLADDVEEGLGEFFGRGGFGHVLIQLVSLARS